MTGIWRIFESVKTDEIVSGDEEAKEPLRRAFLCFILLTARKLSYHARSSDLSGDMSSIPLAPTLEPQLLSGGLDLRLHRIQHFYRKWARSYGREKCSGH